MKKKVSFLLSIILLTTVSSYAQFPYSFTASKQLYTPLTSGTEFFPGRIWTDADIFITPVPFNYKLDTLSCHTFFSEGANSIENDTNATLSSGLLFFEDALEDRGLLTGSAHLSPVRYAVSGTTGSRIFKVEVANAGFNIEKTGFGTMKDSVNVQVWIYEGSNILELRYGTSKVSHATDYFGGNTGPSLLYAKDIDVNGTGVMFAINSDPNNPAIDTIHMLNGTPNKAIHPLDYWPTDSTVYRFTPKTNAVKEIDKIAAKIYPTLCSDHVTIELPNDNATQYHVISITGTQTNIQGTLNNRSTNIDVSVLPVGMYMIQLLNDTGTGVYKFSKI